MKRKYLFGLAGIAMLLSLLGPLIALIPAQKASADTSITATRIDTDHVSVAGVTYTRCTVAKNCTTPSGAYTGTSDSSEAEFYPSGWVQVNGVIVGQPSSYCSVAPSSNIGKSVVGVSPDGNSGSINKVVKTFNQTTTKGTKGSDQCFSHTGSLKFTTPAPSINGAYIDASTIVIDNVTYTDTNVDDTHQFVTPLGSSLNSKNNCPAYILDNFSANLATATRYSSKPGTTGGNSASCEKTKDATVQLSDVSRAKITYIWSSDLTITYSDGTGNVFSRAGATATTLTYNKSASCVVTLTVGNADSSKDTTGTFQASYVPSGTSTTGGGGRSTGNAQADCESSNGGYTKSPITIGALSGLNNVASKDTAATCDVTANGDCGVTEDAPLDCGGGALNWVFCPFVTMLTKGAQLLDSFIAGQLTIDANSIFDTANADSSGYAYHQAWNSFRIIATSLLVIAGLIMVISQAMGLEFLDAYTVRKILPRMLIAIIGISLSWPILRFVVELFNTIGVDIREIIYAPFNHLAGEGGVGGVTAANILAPLLGAGAAFVYGPAALTFILSGFLALLIAFVVLIIRQIGVALLVIFAPVAIVCYILPNTEKVWSFWKTNFLALMLMFPIVEAIIAAGHAFAAVAKNGGFVQQLIGVIAFFAPYFMIPFAFRLAGGMVGSIAGFVNDRGKGVFDRLKGMRQNQAALRSERHGRQIVAKRSEWNNSLKARGRGGQALARMVGGYNIESQMSARNGAVKKELEDQIATGDDTEIRALTARRGEDGQWRTLAGKAVDEGSVRRAKSRWGNDIFAQQTALSYEMRKAMTDAEVASVASGYGEVARGWGMSDRQAGSAWIGSAFENAGTHLEYKYTDWQTGNMDAANAAKYATELYEKKGSYQMSQMTAHSFKKMKDAYDIGNDVTKQKLKSVAETFMQRGGGGGGIATVDDDGKPIMTPTTVGGSREYYQTNSQGAAHTAELVRDFAVHAGVYRPLDPSTETHSARPAPDGPRHG